MPLFLAEHTWEKEKALAATKGCIEGFTGMLTGVFPEGWPEWPLETAKLCLTYMLPGERAICIWEADKAETLENAFKASANVLPLETKITPIVQAFPPGPGLYVMMEQLMEMAK